MNVDYSESAILYMKENTCSNNNDNNYNIEYKVCDCTNMSILYPIDDKPTVDIGNYIMLQLHNYII